MGDARSFAATEHPLTGVGRDAIRYFFWRSLTFFALHARDKAVDESFRCFNDNRVVDWLLEQ